MVLGASEDVEVAFTFKEMVVVSALEAGPSIGASLDAFSDV